MANFRVVGTNPKMSCLKCGEPVMVFEYTSGPQKGKQGTSAICGKDECNRKMELSVFGT